MRGTLYFFACALISLTALRAQSLEPVECPSRPVVLVPGFFNFPSSKVAPKLMRYFSRNIVNAIEAMNRRVIVLENLDSFGTIASNGALVEKSLREISRSYPHCKFDVIAHSAGGLYVAKALTLNPQIPVASVTTISTPYNGAELVSLAGQVPGWESVASFLNLQGLAEFSADNMNAILSSLRVPEEVRWIVVAAKQKPCFLFSCRNPQKLTWILSVGWRFVDSEGDGVVSVHSALAIDQKLLNRSGQLKHIEQWHDLTIPLEHWEIVLEPSIFKFIGIHPTEWLRYQQTKYFQSIVGRL